MFFLLEVTDDCSPGQLLGDGTWDQCVEVGLKLIAEVCGGKVSVEDQNDFRKDGVWTRTKHGWEGVYILSAAGFPQ